MFVALISALCTAVGAAPAGAAPPDLQAVTAGMVDINSVLGGSQFGKLAGTGIVLSSGGEVLTNYHVVEDSVSMTATDLGNGATYPARVVGVDRKRDIAVVQLVGASGLPTPPFGDSTSVRVGDHVVGLGNAGGRGGPPRPAPGVVAALDQSLPIMDTTSGGFEYLHGLIQVSADIQAGDSGGPLVDADGRIVGMDTAAMPDPAGVQGYAIPITSALQTVDQIGSAAAQPVG
ncbi:S1C family serine protease [Speluncibacter jeojiensis]|uniref:S1C family serine protease n=1 Tax=Speluncibacter jeojiensis TaxID=2710754 RepID=UPI00240F271E|nr:trypsin-like peptidase domain-containing protein [Rhodococcus sp. D2-41]